MAQQLLIIAAHREGYGIEQVSETITAGEMIEALKRLDEDTPLYLSHDNGYTYGGITGWNMEIKYLVECPDCEDEVMISEEDYDCPNCGTDLYLMTR